MTNEEVLADFKRRYENTLVWLLMEVDGKEIETLVTVNRIDRDENKIGVLHLTSNEYGSLSINLGSSDHSLLFRYPPVGVFQSGGYAMAFNRVPARQYRRGICSDNSRVLDVTGKVTGRSGRIDLSTIQNAFDAKTYSIGDALKKLTKRSWRSVALPDSYAISKSMCKGMDDHVLFHWQQPIALVSAEGKIKSVLEKIYTPRIEKVLQQ